MSGIDPLKLIRTALASANDSGEAAFTYCTSSGQLLEGLLPECSHIAIQSTPTRLIYPRSVLTNFRSKRGQGPCYPLDAVCFLLDHRDAGYTEYLQEARRIGLTIVSLTDKKELIEYLTTLGDSDLPYIDTGAELPVPLEHFPETPEGRKQQAQQHKRAPPKDDLVSSQPDLAVEGKRVKENTLVSNLVRPALSVNSLFHTDKDFTSVALGLKNVLVGVGASAGNAATTTAAATSGSLFDQISSANPAQKPGQKAPHEPWIIIVPAGTSSLLTLYNAQEFLTAGNYVSVAQAKASGPKPVKVIFKHNNIPFEVVDNPARLALSDWNRVLACFCVSSTWQFKGWKWENPVELFQHILGFHLYFDDVAVDASVAGWNVTKIPISRNKRYLDATASMNFWNRIEESLKSRK